MKDRNIEDVLIDEMIDDINDALEHTLTDEKLDGLSEKASSFKSGRKKREVETLLDEEVEDEVVEQVEESNEENIVDEIFDEVVDESDALTEATMEESIEDMIANPVHANEETGIFDIELSRVAKKEQEKEDKKALKQLEKEEKQNAKNERKGKKKQKEVEENEDVLTVGKKKITWQFYFNLVSILFILGCCFFYGYRLVKHYYMFNPKGEDGQKLVSLGAHIRLNNPVVFEGDGVYNIGGNYVYKGVEVDNYVYYSGMKWRIVRVNMDNTVKIVTDEIVNNLYWNNEPIDYLESNTYTWLNNDGTSNSGIFEKALYDPEKFLDKTKLCVDDVDDLNEIVCSDYQDVGLVNLLGITDFTNSITTDSYINNSANLWLYNSTSEDEVWAILDGNVISSEPNNGYGVKASVTLKNTVVIYDGDGSLENPFIIEDNKKVVGFGDYIEFGEDMWQIYETGEDYYRLIKNSLFKDGETYKFSHINNIFTLTDEFTLASFINHDVFDSFDYADKLIDCDWSIGAYELEEIFDFKNIFSKTVSAKVGLYNVSDIKLNTLLDDYFLLTPSGKDKNFIFESLAGLTDSKSTFLKPIRPAICINKNTKFSAGTGKIDDPFRLEA